MSWQLLTALSVLSLSISVILQRTLLFKTKLDPYAYAVVFQGTVGVLLMLFVLVYGFKLPGIGAVMVPAVISVIFFGVGHIIYAKTLQHVEASAFSVLFATQAVWIMLLGIFLFNESLTVLQVVGSALIFAAVLLLRPELPPSFQRPRHPARPADRPDVRYRHHRLVIRRPPHRRPVVGSNQLRRHGTGRLFGTPQHPAQARLNRRRQTDAQAGPDGHLLRHRQRRHALRL